MRNGITSIFSLWGRSGGFYVPTSKLVPRENSSIGEQLIIERAGRGEALRGRQEKLSLESCSSASSYVFDLNGPAHVRYPIQSRNELSGLYSRIRRVWRCHLAPQDIILEVVDRLSFPAGRYSAGGHTFVACLPIWSSLTFFVTGHKESRKADDDDAKWTSMG